MSAHVFTSRNEHQPVALALVNSENTEAAACFIRTLNELCPEAMKKTQAIISDLTHVYKKAWNSEIGRPVRFIPCSWHLERAWGLNIKDKEILGAAKELRLVTNEENFWSLLDGNIMLSISFYFIRIINILF